MLKDKAVTCTLVCFYALTCKLLPCLELDGLSKAEKYGNSHQKWEILKYFFRSFQNRYIWVKSESRKFSLIFFSWYSVAHFKTSLLQKRCWFKFKDFTKFEGTIELDVFLLPLFIRQFSKQQFCQHWLNN